MFVGFGCEGVATVFVGSSHSPSFLYISKIDKIFAVRDVIVGEVGVSCIGSPTRQSIPSNMDLSDIYFH